MMTIKNISENTYSFRIDNKFTEQDAKDFIDFLEGIPDEKKIKVLGIYKGFPSLESFKTFTETAKLKSKALRKIAKYAIVTDSDFIEFVAPIGNFFTPKIPVKQFDMNEKQEATDWLQKD